MNSNADIEPKEPEEKVELVAEDTASTSDGTGSDTTATAEADTPALREASGRELMRDIGHRLREAREARDETLDDLVRELKLRKVYLQALEQGDWDSLPDEVYAIGFLRQYATHLKLDMDGEINSIRHTQYKLTRPLTFPDPPIAPSRRWAWIAGAGFLILFIIFNVFTGDNDKAKRDIVFSSGSEAGRQQPLPDETQAPAADMTMGSLPEAPESAQNQPASSASADQDSATEEAEAPTPERAAQESSGDATVQPAIIPILPLHRFRFDAVDDEVWLQVFLPDQSGTAAGELRKEVLLRPGHHLTLQETASRLWLTTGNAGALQVSVDGNIVNAPGTLGEIGKVLRDYQVSAEE